VCDHVRKTGPRKWSKIAGNLPGRIGKQCRERCTPPMLIVTHQAPEPPWPWRRAMAADLEVAVAAAAMCPLTMCRLGTAISGRLAPDVTA